ncbi:hypothetical protein [Streptomyces sp. NPDC008122]|uniref:hypothetical protein n=1 Tax=Streptomyces sp. NPDC008122 TaxID=3364810 RepID=UPI0036E44A49
MVLDEDDRRKGADAGGAGPVLRGDQAVRALDLRTGAPRWTAAVPKGCLPREVAVGPKRAPAALACAGEAWRSGSEHSRRSVTAMHAGGGRVTLLTRHGRGHDEPYVFDSATGDTVDERTFSRDEDDGNGELTGLFRYEDLFVAVRRGDGKRQPFSVFRGWWPPDDPSSASAKADSAGATTTPHRTNPRSPARP